MIDIQTLIDTQTLSAKIQPIFRWGKFIALVILIAVTSKIVYRDMVASACGKKIWN